MTVAKRAITLVLMLLLICTGLAACNNSSPDGEGTSTPETTAADARINIREYSIIRPDRASDCLILSMRGVYHAIADEYGFDIDVADDWLQEKDYDSERVAGLHEIIIGTANRPEATRAAEGLPKNGWRVTVDGNKIIAVGVSDIALSEACDALIAALGGLEATEDGRLLIDPAALELSGIAKSYLVGLTDQKNSMVRVCDLTGGTVGLSDTVWSCQLEYYNIADTRLREYEGREVVMAAYGNSSAKMISFDDKKEILWHTDYAAANPHACELLPNGIIAVASSTGGEVRFFDAKGNGSTFVSVTLEDAHGLLWDPSNGVLWAIGTNVLTAYEADIYDGVISVRERTELKNTIPTDSAHDLQPVYGSPDRMWITTTSAVYVYSKSERVFLTEFPGSGKVSGKNVKGIGNFEDGSIVLIRPDGGFKSWTGASLSFFPLRGEDYSSLTVKSGDSGFYKVRVWNKNYQ